MQEQIYSHNQIQETNEKNVCFLLKLLFNIQKFDYYYYSFLLEIESIVQVILRRNEKGRNEENFGREEDEFR